MNECGHDHSVEGVVDPSPNRTSVHVGSIVGHVTERRFERHRVVTLPVAWDEASRRRLRRPAGDGTDVSIALEKSSYLAHGVVLHDDGVRIIVVARTVEPALIVTLPEDAEPRRLIEQALTLGHAFGNQHVPIEIKDGQVRIPLTTNERVARATVAALGLSGVEVSVQDVALAAERPMSSGHAHGGTDADSSSARTTAARHDHHTH